MYPLGKYRQSTGGVAAGSDNNVVYRVFQAENRPMLITALSYYGGDSSEYYQFAQVPPGSALDGAPDGTLTMTDLGGAIPLGIGNIEGATGTQDAPFTFFGNWQRSSGAYWILPPFYTLVVYPVTAASTAALTVWIGGFELGA
jgi:hypothetical protein